MKIFFKTISITLYKRKKCLYNFYMLMPAQLMPWIWLVLTVVFVVVEVLTTSLTTIWFALSAFVMVFLSLLPLPLWVQVLVFAAISLALLIFTRPVLKKHLKIKKTALNADAIIGKKALVTEDITPLQKGAVKVNGLVWTASADGKEISAGRECLVAEIRGATAIVKPLESD
jgi:membrane protein implicated in regulation of membrane protease activity